MSELSYTIEELTEADLSSVLQLADSRLGASYITEAELRNAIQSKRERVLLAKDDSRVLGFAHFMLRNGEVFCDSVLKDEGWFLENFGNEDVLGVFKASAVQTGSAGQGIGTALAAKGMEWLKERTSIQLCPAWAPQGRSGMQSILEKQGFRHLHTIDAYWSKDSAVKGYGCPVCGEPPCRCAMKMYVRNT